MESQSIDMIQQGDVLLRRIQAVKGTKRPCMERGHVLAAGEKTGHAHVITGDVELYEHEGKLYLKTDIAVPLRHEEHREVMIPPGCWEVERVREYDYLTGIIERVQD